MNKRERERRPRSGLRATLAPMIETTRGGRLYIYQVSRNITKNRENTLHVFLSYRKTMELFSTYFRLTRDSHSGQFVEVKKDFRFLHSKHMNISLQFHESHALKQT